MRHLLHLMAVVDYAYAGCGQVQGDPVRQGLHKILDDLKFLSPTLLSCQSQTAAPAESLHLRHSLKHGCGHRNTARMEMKTSQGEGRGRDERETWIVAFLFCDLEHS